MKWKALHYDTGTVERDVLWSMFLICQVGRRQTAKGLLVSNTFDGASVMSGEKGGLQKLVQEHCGRSIPYIHCLNHRL